MVASLNSMLLSQHDPLVHKHCFQNLVFRRVREYFKVTCTLAPFSPAPLSSDTILALIALHPELDGYFSLFLENYELDQDLEFSSDSFNLAFQCMPHLLVSGPFGMVLNTFKIVFT